MLLASIYLLKLDDVLKSKITTGINTFPNISLSIFSSFLAETGLVSVEHQMQEIGLANKDGEQISKKSN